MKEHFGFAHSALKKARAFEQPTFGKKPVMQLNKGWKGKKLKKKKASTNKTLTYKERQSINIL